ncbi:tetratricopeptide repeat protein [Salinimicrobium xinjiangense]|uniref:tetratricopeptide repeat protein n=1 Tax=Salinimicrobium xinjiangense TaxID=438596 RepID=UPI00040DCAF8|nr:tetratricopeptide repeat protein [Salinimicrobium xinjiangense]
MNIFRKSYLLLFLIYFPCSAQITDTLNLAREKAYQQNFSEADALLSQYNKKNRNVYALWLQAQISYWKGDFERSKNLYRQAIALSPGLSELKLDYGSTLFKMGDVEDSGKILKSYLKDDPANPNALIMLAYFDYWKGKTNKAAKTIRQVLEVHPEHEMAAKLIREINYARAPHVSLNSEFVSDDQPLDAQHYNLTAGKYFSGVLSPFVSLKYRNFDLPAISVQSVQVEIGNRFQLGMNGPEVHLSGGIIKPHQERDSLEFLGRAAISQKLVKHLNAEVATARLPYQYTLASIEEPLMHQLSSVALSFNNPQSIVGKLAYERQDFPDDNIIHTSYLYLLKSVLRSGSFRLDLGYSFNYAHSVKNSFQPVEESFSGQGLISSKNISGIYDPYFSPQNQMVNSALASIHINPTDAFEIKMRANYGFYAKAEQPFFSSAQTPGNRMATGNNFYEEQYTPVEFFAGIALKVSPQMQLRADYQFSNLLFYELHNLGFSVSYSFLSNSK